MTKINAQVVADSKNEFGDRITTLLITFPRIILAEVNTHRMLSKNTSSSRAIPFSKIVESVQNDPFIPIVWQKDHKGMQGNDYYTEESHILLARGNWLIARDNAIKAAKTLNGNIISSRGITDSTIENTGVTKQLCNRLLEPFMWCTMLITGTDDGWNNFFNLRCPQYVFGNKTFKSKKEIYNEIGSDLDAWPHEDNLWWYSINKGQAEIHMMELAECIYDVMQESKPKDLLKGEWHIPFLDKIDDKKTYEAWVDNYLNEFTKVQIEDGIAIPTEEWFPELELCSQTKVKISTGMAARTSYTVVGDEKEPDYKALINIHDKCLEMNHSSVFEHCARVMNKNEYVTSIKGRCTLSLFEEDNIISPVRNEGWCRNYRGFIQYRHILEEKFS